MTRAFRRLNSTTARIAIALLIVQVGSVGLTLLVMHKLTQQGLTRSAQDYALELRADISDRFRRGGIAMASDAVAQRLAVVGRRDAVVVLARSDGTVLAGNLADWPATVEPSSRWRAITLYRIGARQPELMGVTSVELSRGYRLLTGQVMEDEDRLARASELGLIIALLAGLLLALVASLGFARVIGRRVARIAETANAVSGGDLSQRIPDDGSGDAFDRLADAINAMLARIETLVTELRLVTDALAHDLRSPVSRLKATIERALQGTRDASALEALGSAADEADGLLRMLTAALQISRAEAGLGADQFTTFDAAEMVVDLAEVYGPLAEEQGFAVHASVPDTALIRAHRQLLGQALANLIDNALKYATGGTRIGIALEQEDGRVSFSVTDDGPGIPPNRRDEAIRRFGRLDPARQAGGAGLGLSLVATVAHLHGGTMILEDGKPGLRVVLRLPIAAGVEG